MMLLLSAKSAHRSHTGTTHANLLALNARGTRLVPSTFEKLQDLQSYQEF
jgi:hypothetical protein